MLSMSFCAPHSPELELLADDRPTVADRNNEKVDPHFGEWPDRLDQRRKFTKDENFKPLRLIDQYGAQNWEELPGLWPTGQPGSAAIGTEIICLKTE
jgi:hypothetical protein